MSADEFTPVAKAVRGEWRRWEELEELDRLLVRYETPAGFEHQAYEWLWDGAQWLVRPVASHT